MHRKFFCCGNWKMNVLKKEIDDLIENLKKKVAGIEVDLVIAPPSVYLQYTLQDLPNTFRLGAQNCYKCKLGNFTGELSPAMLLEIGVTWVILGHSERRNIFGETDELICEKIQHALSEGLSVIVCIGETLEQRDEELTADVIMSQLRTATAVINDWEKVVLAYEPVWSMGTGISCSLAQAQEVHKLIRKWILERVSADVADSVRIVYGGSVNPGNCKDLNRQRDIDGFLVSGSSLVPEFAEICNIGF